MAAVVSGVSSQQLHVRDAGVTQRGLARSNIVAGPITDDRLGVEVAWQP
jgi:hypothetical protein